jgi:hypothetical protein
MPYAFHRLPLVASVFLVASLFAAPACAQAPISPEWTTARYSYANLSPDGRFLAIAVPQDGGDRVAVIDLSNGTQPVSYPFEDGIVNGLLWRGNDTPIVQLYGRFTAQPITVGVAYITHPKTTDRPTVVTFRGPTTDAGIRSYSDYGWGSTNDVVDLMPDEEDFFYMAAIVYRSPNTFYTAGVSGGRVAVRDLLRVDEETGVSTTAVPGNEDTAQWFLDGGGNVVARVDLLPSGAQIIPLPDGDRRQWRERPPNARSFARRKRSSHPLQPRIECRCSARRSHDGSNGATALFRTKLFGIDLG